MTVIFRGRVDPQKLKRAQKVASDLSTSVLELFRMFITQVARTGAVPVSLTVGQEEEMLFSKERRNKIWKELDDAEGW